MNWCFGLVGGSGGVRRAKGQGTGARPLSRLVPSRRRSAVGLLLGRRDGSWHRRGILSPLKSWEDDLRD